MKYLILVYSSSDVWEHPLYRHDPAFLGLSQPERDELEARAEAIREEIVASGELVEGVALADPVTARTARPGPSGATVTDGPYLETKEQLAGFFVVDCETPDRASEIAASFLESGLAAVEVRPFMGTAGEEM